MELNAKFKLSPDLKSINQEIEKLNNNLKSKFKKINKQLSLGKDIVNVKSITKEFDKLLKPQRKLQIKIQKITTKDFLNLDKIKSDVQKVLDNIASKPLKIKVEYDNKLPKVPKVLSAIELSEDAAKLLDKLSKPIKIEIEKEGGAVAKNATAEKYDSELAKTASEILKSIQGIGRISDVLDALKNLDIKKAVDFGDIEGLKTSVDNSSKTMSASIDVLQDFHKSFTGMVPEFKNIKFDEKPIVVHETMPTIETKVTQVEAPKVSGGLEHLIGIQNQMLGVLGNISDKLGEATKNEGSSKLLETQEKVAKAIENLGGRRGQKQPLNVDRALLKQITAFSNVLVKVKNNKDITKRLDSALKFLSVGKNEKDLGPTKKVIDELKSLVSLGKVNDKAVVGILTTVKTQLKENPTEELREIVRAFTLAKTTSELGTEKKKEKYLNIAPNNQLTKNLKDIKEVAKRQFGAALSGFKKQSRADVWLKGVNDKIKSISVVGNKKEKEEVVPGEKSGMSEKIGIKFISATETMVGIFKKGMDKFVGSSEQFFKGKESKSSGAKNEELNKIAEDLKELASSGIESDKEIKEITKNLEVMTDKMGALGTATHDAGMEIKGSGMVTKLEILQDTAKKVSFKGISKGMQGMALGAKAAGSGIGMLGRSAKIAGMAGLKGGLLMVSGATRATKGSVKSVFEFGGALNKTLSASADAFKGFDSKSLLNPFFALPRLGAALGDELLQGAKKLKQNLFTPGGVIKGIKGGAAGLTSSMGIRTHDLQSIGGMVTAIVDRFRRISDDFDSMSQASYSLRMSQNKDKKQFTGAGVGGMKLPNIGRVLGEGWNMSIEEMNRLMETVGEVKMSFGGAIKEAMHFADALTHFNIDSFSGAVEMMSDFGKSIREVRGDYGIMLAAQKGAIKGLKSVDMPLNSWISAVKSGATEVFKYGVNLNYVNHAYAFMVNNQNKLFKGLNMTKQALMAVGKSLLSVWGTMTEGFAAATGVFTDSVRASTDPLGAMFKNLGYDMDKVAHGAISVKDAGTGKEVGGTIIAAQKYSVKDSPQKVAETLRKGLAVIAYNTSGMTKDIDKLTGIDKQAAESNAMYAQRRLIAEQMFQGSYDAADVLLTAIAKNGNDADKFFKKLIKGDKEALKAMNEAETLSKDQRSGLVRISDQIQQLNDILAGAAVALLETIASLLATLLTTLMLILKTLGNYLVMIAKSIANGIKDIVDTLGDMVDALLLRLQKIWLGVTHIFGGGEKEQANIAAKESSMKEEQLLRRGRRVDEEVAAAAKAADAEATFGDTFKKIEIMTLGTVQNFMNVTNEVTKAIGKFGEIMMSSAKAIRAATGAAWGVNSAFQSSGDALTAMLPLGENTANLLYVLSDLFHSPALLDMAKKQKEIESAMKKVPAGKGGPAAAGAIFKAGANIANVAKGGLDAIKEVKGSIDETIESAYGDIASGKIEAYNESVAKITKLQNEYAQKTRDTVDALKLLKESAPDVVGEHTEGKTAKSYIQGIIDRLEGVEDQRTKMIQKELEQMNETAKKSQEDLKKMGADTKGAKVPDKQTVQSILEQRNSFKKSIEEMNKLPEFQAWDKAMSALDKDWKTIGESAGVGANQRYGGMVGHFASGGLAGHQKQFSGIKLDSDGMLAQLHPPEYVVSEKGLRATGLPVLDAINAGRWPQIVDMIQKSSNSPNLDEFFGNIANVPKFQDGGNSGNGLMYSVDGGAAKTANLSNTGNIGGSANSGRSNVVMNIDSKPTMNLKVMPDASPQQIEKVKAFVLQRLEDAVGKVYDDVEKTIESMWTS